MMVSPPPRRSVVTYHYYYIHYLILFVIQTIYCEGILLWHSKPLTPLLLTTCCGILPTATSSRSSSSKVLMTTTSTMMAMTQDDDDGAQPQTTTTTTTTNTTTVINKTWMLKRHPQGYFDADHDVTLQEDELDLDTTLLNDDEIWIQPQLFSVDAFVRTMMDEGAFHGTVSPGKPLLGMAWCTVIAAGPKVPKSHRVGAHVLGFVPVSLYSKTKASAIAAVKPKRVLNQPSLSLGLLGISGLTAYTGMFLVPPRKKRLQSSSTVVVSAAAGAVGMIAVQLARLRGVKRVIGIAGGSQKAAFLKKELQLDGVIDYKHDSLSLQEQIDQTCPDGIDFFFDNTGGPILDAVLDKLNQDSMVVLCGAISQYGDGSINKKNNNDKQGSSSSSVVAPGGAVYGPSNYIKLAERNSLMVGFTLDKYMKQAGKEGRNYLAKQYSKGRIVLPEHVEQGIESFPKAIEMLFNGGHIGRLLVDVKEEK